MVEKGNDYDCTRGLLLEQLEMNHLMMLLSRERTWTGALFRCVEVLRACTEDWICVQWLYRMPSASTARLLLNRLAVTESRLPLERGKESLTSSSRAPEEV